MATGATTSRMPSCARKCAADCSRGGIAIVVSTRKPLRRTWRHTARGACRSRMTWLALPRNGRASEGQGVSAVIYAAIVVMWAVVLVPMWLRRHDAATESRSVERFSTAMRTLSRRNHATPGRRYVVMPRRQPGTVSVHVSGAALAGAPVQATARPAAPAVARPVRPAVSAARASMVRRRRRTTFVLVGLVVLTALLAAVGLLPMLVQLAVDVVFLAFLAHLRAQAKRTAAAARQRGRGAAAAVRPAARPAAAVPTPAVRRPVEPAAQPVVAATVDVTWSDEAPAQAVEVEVEVAGDETWEPVPVPPPTYTLKPPAPAVPAASDDPDATGEHAPVADDLPTDLDEILERRWAVND